MSMRAILVAGLLITGAAVAVEWDTTATVAAGSIPDTHAAVPATPLVKSTTLSEGTAPKNNFAVARWDGKIIDGEAEVRGLNDDARQAIETWRDFAVRRGYRVDLEESQRVLVVSDSNRFRRFRRSATVIERTLRLLEPFSTPGEATLVLLRASNQKDLDTALRAAKTLGFDNYLAAYIEDGSRSDRRTVEARLAEAIVRQQLDLEQPFLSEWMAGGIASYIAEKTTGRAIIAGEAETLRSVQSAVARATGGDSAWRVSLYEVSGVNVGGQPTPRESEALAIVAHLSRNHADSFAQMVAHLGSSPPENGRAKYLEEERMLELHVGKTALGTLSRALQQGRSFRR